jgi:hypothetical protein
VPQLKNIFRLVLSGILCFGWLLGGTSQASNDPISIAAQDIAKLESDLENLANKSATQEKIDFAKSKYDVAIVARNSLLEAQSDLLDAENALEDAQNAEDAALSEKQSAQLAVNNQQPIRDAAYTTKQDKQTTLDAANVNVQTQASGNQPQTNTLDAYLYDCWTWWNIYNSAPELECPQGRGNGVPAAMGPWSGINFNFGSGGPAGLYDDYQIKWIGYIKTTQYWTPQFRVCSDDGMILKISGITVVNNWYDRGGGCGYPNGYYMSSNGWEPIEVWWYENGGGANGSLQWNIGNGWIVIPANVFSITLPQNSPEYQAALAAQATAQQEYDTANATYKTENDKFVEYQKTLTTKTNTYNNTVDAREEAEADIQDSEDNVDLAQDNYDTAISEMQNAIINARNKYNEQWKFEENQRVAAAIAQAMANQPQPTPQPTPEPSPTQSIEPTPEPTIKPSPEPTPEPSPEQTKPNDPTPTPSPDITDKPEPTVSPDPEPTVEPSPEPSPLPTDINPTPTPEPEPTPVEPSPKPSNNSSTEDLSNMIANLTSKDNIVVKLTPEQAAAVANVLVSLAPEAKAAVAKDFGIKTEEVAVIANLAKDNPAIAAAVVSFNEKAKENADAPMPYTLSDAITEATAEQLLEDPLAVFSSIELDKVLDPSQWGKDMTDDQREKAQEVVIPVILVSNIIASVASALSTRRL